jgi:enoyl-[acyl-carrier-protein] reductase (NADH)
MTDSRQPWALILGASSGFGEATAKAWRPPATTSPACTSIDAGMARRRDQGRHRRPRARGLYVNMNVADDGNRPTLAALRTVRRQAKETGRAPYVRVLMHSLAFGTLKPFLGPDADSSINRKNLEMTLDVMANSLVYWAQDTWRGGFLGDGSKVYAMTSEGSTRVITNYGAVSAAKTALESNCRQLAMEFAKLRTGVTVNAIRAGVTVTPALMQIPERDLLIEHAMSANPHGRMTTVDDVAQAIVTLSAEGTHWITGNVLGVDGGELISG